MCRRKNGRYDECYDVSIVINLRRYTQRIIQTVKVTGGG